MRILDKNFINEVLFSLKIKDFLRLINLQSPHGDAEHMGEANYLIKKIKVEKVIFNCGKYNNLEKN